MCPLLYVVWPHLLFSRWHLLWVPFSTLSFWVYVCPFWDGSPKAVSAWVLFFDTIHYPVLFISEFHLFSFSMDSDIWVFPFLVALCLHYFFLPLYFNYWIWLYFVKFPLIFSFLLYISVLNYFFVVTIRFIQKKV